MGVYRPDTGVGFTSIKGPSKISSTKNPFFNWLKCSAAPIRSIGRTSGRKPPNSRCAEAAGPATRRCVGSTPTRARHRKMNRTPRTSQRCGPAGTFGGMTGEDPVRAHIPADVGSNPTPAPSADTAHVFILLPPLPGSPPRWAGIDAVLVQRQHVGFPSRKCRFDSDVSLHAGIIDDDTIVRAKVGGNVNKPDLRADVAADAPNAGKTPTQK